MGMNQIKRLRSCTWKYELSSGEFFTAIHRNNNLCYINTTANSLLSSPSLLSPSLPSPIYSLLINDRLYQSTTTVKLHVDWSRMVYSPTGSLDLLLILGCTTSNFSYLCFSTLYFSSFRRTETMVFAKQNKAPISNMPPGRFSSAPPPPLECDWNK